MSAPVDLVLERLDGVHRISNGWEARCPAHSDREPSLSVSEGADGRVLVHCHVGCATKDVLSLVKLTWADLYPSKSANTNGKRSPVASYPYVDEGSELLFWVHKYAGKQFRQQAADGTWSTKDIRKPLYHLPEVLAAV